MERKREGRDNRTSQKYKSWQSGPVKKGMVLERRI